MVRPRFDAKGRIIDFNSAFASIHRFKDKAGFSGVLDRYPTIMEVYTADGKLAPLDQWAIPRALRGETATNAECTLRRKDTGETWVGSYSFGPIRDKSGVVVGSVVVGRDITQSKRTEEALKRLNDTLEQSISSRLWPAPGCSCRRLSKTRMPPIPC